MPTKQKKQMSKNKEESVSSHVIKSAPPWVLVLIGVAVTVVIAGLAFGGSAYLAARRQEQAVLPTIDFNGGRFTPRGGGLHRIRGGDNSLQVIAVQGVVTSIKGDKIMIAGHGKKVTVKKTDSTVISGDEDTLAVNDSVSVVGSTASDGTVTATRIIVQNSTGSSFSASVSWGSQTDTMPGA